LFKNSKKNRRLLGDRHRQAGRNPREEGPPQRPRSTRRRRPGEAGPRPERGPSRPDSCPGRWITGGPWSASSSLRTPRSLRWSLFRTALQVVSSEESQESGRDGGGCGINDRLGCRRPLICGPPGRSRGGAGQGPVPGVVVRPLRGRAAGSGKATDPGGDASPAAGPGPAKPAARRARADGRRSAASPGSASIIAVGSPVTRVRPGTSLRQAPSAAPGIASAMSPPPAGPSPGPRRGRPDRRSGGATRAGGRSKVN
jgi:hypothetical protein